MRKTREILRLHFEGCLSQRTIARAMGVSNSTVSEVFSRLKATGLCWPLPQGMTDTDLERRLYRGQGHTAPDPREPDWAHVHCELRRKHVTLMLLWQEYKLAYPDGFQYSWFCERYRAFQAKVDVVMRCEHVFGEKLFVDWAGDTVALVDGATGETTRAYLFVAVMGASNYTYAEVSRTQDTQAFIAAHVRAMSFYGGSVELLVCDNLKTGVKHPDRYEPELNPSYADMASHYGCAVLPTRVRRPRDKAKVEVGVLVAYRSILAPLRNRTFFSLAEANQAVRARLAELNARPFKKLSGSRSSVFFECEAPRLGPLPAEPYTYRTRKSARVHIDYHVELCAHYYSVPYHLVREQVEVSFDDRTVEIFHRGERVALHRRSHRKGGFTTDPAHMPEGHRRVASWTPERIEAWARGTGPATARLVAAVMASRRHPELAFRSCLGILRLKERYGPQRLEAASERALVAGARSYKSVRSILERGLDAVALDSVPIPVAVPDHDNVRGAAYYA